jgi:hypothetical protein
MESPSAPIRVLVVDDDPQTTMGFAASSNQQGTKFGRRTYRLVRLPQHVSFNRTL